MIPYSLYIKEYFWSYGQKYYKSIIFQQLKSQISQIDQNGFNPFCDKTLHIKARLILYLLDIKSIINSQSSSCELSYFPKYVFGAYFERVICMFQNVFAANIITVANL